jgi:hypothetical protein
MEIEKARQIAIEVLEEVEDFLQAHGVNIPNKEREEYETDEDTEKAILFGSEYYTLEDTLTRLIEKALCYEQAAGKAQRRTRIISKSLDKERKCPCCNWECSTVYSFTCNNIDEEGLCAHCFMDMLVEEGFGISSREQQRKA